MIFTEFFFKKLTESHNFKPQKSLRPLPHPDLRIQYKCCMSFSENISFEELQAYDVADLVKQYFRELPECLLTNKLSDIFISIFICKYIYRCNRLEFSLVGKTDHYTGVNTPYYFLSLCCLLMNKLCFVLSLYFYAPAIRRMRKGIKRCPCPSVRLSVRPSVCPWVLPFVHHLGRYFVSATPPTIFSQSF